MSLPSGTWTQQSTKPNIGPPDAFTRTNGLPAVPIVLGFVGHRDPEPADLATLRQKLADVFYQFRNTYRYTPLVLLTSLAEGADQLAARVALENNVFVRVPMPLPLDAFRQSTSFTTETARAELSALLADTRVEAFEVPLPETCVPSGFDWRAVASDRDEGNSNLRRICYANAGGYIVRHSHVLIALSDDSPADPARPSGTAEFVRFKLQGIPPDRYPWADLEPLGFRGERGPVYMIHTPRAKEHSSASESGVSAGRASVRLPAEGKPFQELGSDRTLARGVSPLPRKLALYRLRMQHGISEAGAAELLQFRETCQAVDDFNRDVANSRTPSDLHDQLSKLDRAMPDDLASGDCQRVWLKRISATRAAAGHLSRELEPALESMQLWVLAIIGIGVAMFHLYAHPLTADFVPDAEDHEPVWLVLFLCALLLAGVIVVSAWLRRLDARRLDYRALAEGLRVRRAWAVAGIGASVADSYLSQMRGEMTWARQALRNVCPPARVWSDRFDRLTPEQQRTRLEALRTDWVMDQIDHMRKSHHEEEFRARWLRRVGILLAVLGWLWIPVCLLINHSVTVGGGPDMQTVSASVTVRQIEIAAVPPGGQPASGAHSRHGEPRLPAGIHRPMHWWLVASGLLVIAGGLCIAFRQHRAHEELAKQYERMHLVFENGQIELERRLRAGDIRGSQAVLKALGQEAITENAQWLILRRARPVEFHLA
jgi:hypothetical protein